MHGTLPSNRRSPKSRTQKIEPQAVVFRDLVRVAFPRKPVAALGHLCGASRSTIHCWLNGEHHPPDTVLALVLAEIMRRLAGQ